MTRNCIGAGGSPTYHRDAGAGWAEPEIDRGPGWPGQKRIGMRRAVLWIAPVVLVAVFGAGATFFAYQNYPWLFPIRDSVRIATGPLSESEEKFLDAFVRE